MSDDAARDPTSAAASRGRRWRPESVAGAKYVAILQDHLDRLHAAYDHGNRQLFFDHVLCGYLMAFFNLALRSQRTIDDYSQTPAGQEVLGVARVARVARSTFSDASQLFDADRLAPRARSPTPSGSRPTWWGCCTATAGWQIELFFRWLKRAGPTGST